jgi:hypothetical protein
VVVFGRRDEECIGPPDRLLERHDLRWLAGVLDILVVERDGIEGDDVDDEAPRRRLDGRADQASVVRRASKAAREPQDPDLVHRSTSVLTR